MNDDKNGIVKVGSAEFKRLQAVDHEVAVLRRVNVGLLEALRKMSQAESEYNKQMAEVAKLREEIRNKRQVVYREQMQVVLELVEVKRTPT